MYLFFSLDNNDMPDGLMDQCYTSKAINVAAFKVLNSYEGQMPTSETIMAAANDVAMTFLELGVTHIAIDGGSPGFVHYLVKELNFNNIKTRFVMSEEIII